MTHTLVLFDIDGTILRAHGAGKVAFDRAFYELYQIEGVFGATEAHGRTDPDIIKEISQKVLGRVLSAVEEEELSERYIIHLRETLPESRKFEVMPGVPELVERLSQQKDVVLGIQTGNFQKAAFLKLEQAGLSQYFQIGGYGSDAYYREKIIETAISRARNLCANPISRIIAIGDSHNDIQSGKTNGADTIGVLTGGMAREDLERAEPDLLVDTLELSEELLEFFRLSQ